jgi:hypothetical protein
MNTRDWLLTIIAFGLTVYTLSIATGPYVLLLNFILVFLFVHVVLEVTPAIPLFRSGR